MPIYAYRCASCGHAKDVLQKMSDPVLIDCPACGAASFVKQVTAAGFQLKGSGWYVTDFKGSGAAPSPSADAAKVDAAKGDAATGEAAKSDAAKPDATSTAAKTAAKTDAPAAAPAPTPAPSGAAPAAGAK